MSTSSREISPYQARVLRDNHGIPDTALPKTQADAQNLIRMLITQRNEVSRHEKKRRKDELDKVTISRILVGPEDDPPCRNSREVIKIYKAMPYREYLKTPWWQKIRAACVARWKNRCALCYSSGRIDVHHRTYLRLGAELDTDVIALCHTCHGKHHRTDKVKRGSRKRAAANP